MMSAATRCSNWHKFCKFPQVITGRETRDPVLSTVFRPGFTSRLFHVNCGVMSIRLFEEKHHAELYSKYRPKYPDTLYETIIDYCKSGDSNFRFELAVDVGCGSGQSTLPLCKYFKNVIGTDVSEQQISSTSSAANSNGNLEFRVGVGEDLHFLSDGSVDLLTIAQALHWMSREKFYPEVTRVLRPGGVFVAYGYGNNVLANREADRLQKQFYYDLLEGPLGAYWNSRRQHIETHYREIEPPFPNSDRLETEPLAIYRKMPLDAYVGYISTWSGWRKYLAKYPESDALDVLTNRLRGLYGRETKHEDVEIAVHWPGFMMIGRKIG